MRDRGMLAALALVATLSGCSWALMETLPKDYDGTTEPRCTATSGFAAWDAVFLVADIAFMAGMVAIDGDEPGELDTTPVVLVTGVEAVLHAASALSGRSAALRCRLAREQWDSEAEARAHVERTEREREREERARRQAAEAQAPERPARTAGYYCTISPADSSIGACNTSREACAASQKRLVTAGHDVGPCTEAEHAVCFTATKADGTEVSGCTPTVKGCMRQRENASTNPEYTTVGDCADR